MNSFFKILICAALVIVASVGITNQIALDTTAVPAYSKQGSRGKEVEAIQQTLRMSMRQEW